MKPIAAITLASLVTTAYAEVDYLAEVKPLLRSRCFACHGALKQKAKLRVDTVKLMLEAEAIVPNRPEQSTLLERIATDDVDDRMPPKHEGEPFSPAEIRVIRDWIAQGAKAPPNETPEASPEEHRAFQPVKKPDVPAFPGNSRIRNPIDAFVAARHAERGLTPQPEASRLELIRRLYLDLIGLPPPQEELAALHGDASPDWYERLADKLLADRRHGERWARHWMDVWRYSDWWGLGAQHRNSHHHIWHWRDWIVEALNADAGYDEMVRLMLAADELHPNDTDKLRATGYLARNFYLFNRDQWMEEVVEHVGKGFLGLTMNCAKCHEHKYDPISQADFYRMRAFFEPYHVRVDMIPNEPDLAKNGIPRAYDAFPDAPTYRYERGESSQPDTSTKIAPGVPELLAFANLDVRQIALPVEARQPERQPWVVESHVAAARQKLASADDTNRPLAQAELTSVMCRAEAMRANWTGGEAAAEAVKKAVKAEREEALVRARLEFSNAEAALQKAEEKKREAARKKVDETRKNLEKAEKTAKAPIGEDASYTKLDGAKWVATRFANSRKDDADPGFPPHSTGRRTALANWIVDRRNPLTARVAVNHIWQRHFGKGLVSPTFEFGRAGMPPSHPRLLDWLAAELVESGWSMKHLHRLIVTSAAYRMSSSNAGAEANLAADPENRLLWRREAIRLEAEVIRDTLLALTGELDLSRGGPPVPAKAQAASKRRSLYFFHSNNERNLFLTTFDEAMVKECYQRDQTIVPQQALALSNSALVHDSAPKIATRLVSGANPDDAAFVRRAFALLLGIDAGEAEISASVRALEAWRAQSGTDAAQARANLVWALLNHNDFVTLR